MKKLLAVVLTAVMLTVGCSTAWVSEFTKILAVAAPAIGNVLQIVAIVDGKPVNSGLISKIDGDVADLSKIATDLQAASQAAKPGVQAQLNVDFKVFQDDINEVFRIAQVSDTKTQVKILALEVLIQSTVQIAESLIPSNNPVAFNKEPAVLSANQFINSYNQTMTAKVGNPEVDKKTSGLQIHYHSKFVRLVSFGTEK